MADNFLKSLFDSLFGRSAEGGVNRKQLKQIRSQIKRSHLYFYDVHYGELTENFARFLYQLYKFFYPIHNSFKIYFKKNSHLIKGIIVENCAGQEVMELHGHFSEEFIRAQLQTRDLKEVFEDLKKDFASFKRLLLKEVEGTANEVYAAFQVLSRFINFDYYYLLKQFDDRLPENDFVYRPNFIPLHLGKELDLIKDLASLIESYSGDKNWDTLFELFNEMKGVELVSVAQWKKYKRSLDEVHRTKILDLIIALNDEDPAYFSKPMDFNENILSAYIENVNKELQKVLNKIISEKKKQNVHEIVRQLFDGKIPPNRMRNYTEYISEGIDSAINKKFLYVAAVSFLKSFFLDCFKKDVWEICNSYIIVGKWIAPQDGQTMSEILNSLMEQSNALSEFDDSLGDSSRQGQLIRSYSRNVNPRTKIALERLVSEVNDEAKALLNESFQFLVRLAKGLRMIIDDFEPKKMFTNWKEIENAYKIGDLQRDTQTSYRKIYDMVKILKIYLST